MAMDRELLLHSMEMLKTAITTIIRQEGDVLLSVDEWSYNIPEGALIVFRQVRARHPPRLKFGMILNAVHGLMEVLIVRQNYCEVGFTIKEEGINVGTGRIRAVRL